MEPRMGWTSVVLGLVIGAAGAMPQMVSAPSLRC